MATTSTTRAASVSEALPTVVIQPPRGWLELDFAEMWAYRELLYFFVWRDIKVRYKQTVVGVGWAILQPFATMVVFALFFGVLAKLPPAGIPYPIFFYCALLPWTYFAGALSGATNTVVENQRLITKVYFPRILLPLASVISGLVDFVIAFVMLLAMAFYYGIVPTAAALLLPAFLLLAILTALAAGLWLSALNAIYRDVRYVMPFLVQFWMFASPVAYPSTLVPERFRWIYGLNPMAGVIEGFRWAITGQGQAPGVMIFVSAGVVIVMLIGGLVYFRRMEGTVADVV
ncbi:MAG: ABC transporter permease [Acidobacteria bacterium]|nr:ABC transporter permease [Acidobacteriota bacterium]MCL5287195.1 ABC transporter permease [Acidobacteriota bacterium]